MGFSDNLPYEKVGKNEPICIADDVPFDIPENWEWVRFKNLVSYNMGKTPPRKESEYWENATYPWVSIADLVLDDTVCVTKERVNEHSAKVIFKNHISKAGTLLMSFKLTVGKVSILGMDAFHNEAIISIYPFCDVNRVITNYLFVTLPLLSQNGNTKTAIKGATLNSDSLDALLIPVPPIKEQIRICEKIKVLKNILSIYTNLEQSLTRLNDAFPLQLKKSILQYAVQGKLVPQDPADEPASVLLARIRAEKEQLIKAGKIKRDKHESVIFRRDNSYYEQVDGIERCIDDELPFEIPKSWEWTRLSTIAKVLGGKRIPAGRKLTAENTGHVYIRVSDMKDGTVIQNGLLYVPEDIFNSISKYIIKKEDVFITVAGTIGRIGKIPPELDGANLTENADRLVFSSLNQDWMIFLLQSSFIQNQIAEVTTKVGQPKLAIARIEKLLIPLPPLNEQTRIVEQIAVIFSQMKKL